MRGHFVGEGFLFARGIIDPFANELAAVLAKEQVHIELGDPIGGLMVERGDLIAGTKAGLIEVRLGIDVADDVRILLERFFLAACEPNDSEGKEGKNKIYNRACECDFDAGPRGLSIKSVSYFMGFKGSFFLHAGDLDVAAKGEVAKLPFDPLEFPGADGFAEADRKNFDLHSYAPGYDVVA